MAPWVFQAGHFCVHTYKEHTMRVHYGVQGPSGMAHAIEQQDPFQHTIHWPARNVWGYLGRMDAEGPSGGLWGTIAAALRRTAGV
jgi:hypothetical protein